MVEFKRLSTQTDSADVADGVNPSRLRRAMRRIGPRVRMAFYLVAGVFTPIVCFACAAQSGNWAADQPWQAGQFWVYATLLLKWPAATPFYPLLLYSMAAIGLFAWDRRRFARSFAVRLGIFGGVLLALQYCWLVYAPGEFFNKPLELLQGLVIIAFMIGAVVAATVLSVFLVWLIWTAYRAARHDLGAKRIVAVAAAFAGLVVLGVFVFTDDPVGSLLNVLVVPAIVVVIFGPAWAILAYVAASLEILYAGGVQWRWNLKHVLGATAWVACLFGAWRRAMNLAITEYATLPVEDPNCFICSAAARGHRMLVRSKLTTTADGRILRVNGQMRTLKAGELALKAVSPGIHRLLRRFYNWVGPPLAKQLNDPWVADLAYLALKPAEWLVRALLCAFGGVGNTEIALLYRHHAANPVAASASFSHVARSSAVSRQSRSASAGV